ncbi:MAG: WecB/TagA/CpsF family glycosyltransferase [Pirellulaceae bacterium]|nr:WecB/TagA/CpsF family glycosyltransferase [Pirellulaceae bacterium]
MIQKQKLFGMEIDALNMGQAIARLREWLDESRLGKCRYVVTPNVDHAVLWQEHEGLRDAYRKASLVLADGHPLVWASRLLRRPLPERVPGSDLVPKFFDHCQDSGREVRVFLLGAAPGVGARAVEKIRKRWPLVNVVGVYSPPLGFEKDPDENEIILGRLILTRPDLLVVGLGAPKQECWVAQHHEHLAAKAALCVGATIDFLAGEKRRAPYWMQCLGVEWLHRMLSEPRRLVKRYAKDAWVFPQLVLKQMLSPSRAWN